MSIEGNIHIINFQSYNICCDFLHLESGEHIGFEVFRRQNLLPKTQLAPPHFLEQNFLDSKLLAFPPQPVQRNGWQLRRRRSHHHRSVWWGGREGNIFVTTQREGLSHMPGQWQAAPSPYTVLLSRARTHLLLTTILALLKRQLALSTSCKERHSSPCPAQSPAGTYTSFLTNSLLQKILCWWECPARNKEKYIKGAGRHEASHATKRG